VIANEFNETAMRPALLMDEQARSFEKLATGRRSVYQYLKTPVPLDVIEWAIGLAALAPNHYRTKPWRCFVFAGEGLHALAEVYARVAARLGRDAAKVKEKIYATPAAIVVACVPATDHPKVKIHEEEMATAAAIQNLMLALSSAGIGSLWTTGDTAASDEIKTALGLESNGRVIGVVQIGYADRDRTLPARAAADLATISTWRVS